MDHPEPKPIRVLLLEDTEADRLVVEEGLRSSRGLRFELAHAPAVAELIALIPTWQPDLLLIDLCVHDSRGIETFRRVHAAAGDRPVIVQSGLDEEGLALAAVREGAQDYLVKGRFDGHQLVRAIRYAFERHRTERALRASEERYALAAAGANDGIWDWDLRSGRLWLSPRWQAIAGFGPGELEPRPDAWFDLVARDDVEGFAAAIAAHADGVSPQLEHEHRIRHRDGQLRWVLCRGMATRDAAGRAVRMAGSLTDITARKRAEARLLHDAFHDPLTGLANRALCLDRIGHALHRARRQPGHPFAVLFLDLDRFKSVNDSLGHSAGDRLLCAIADRLHRVVRPADTVARFGGDEFCLVVEDMRCDTDAVRVAERAQRALATPFDLGGSEVFTSASIGIAVFGPDHHEPEDLVRDADLAMYRAKQGGKARHKMSDSGLHTRAVAMLELETDLRKAIDRHELFLVYQPIVALSTGRTVGVEALARWRSPTRGLVSPAEFIPLCEETGLIVPVGRQVLTDAISQMATWQRQHGAGLSVSVNVSARQLVEPDLASHVIDTLREFDFDPTRLVLEITESVFIQDWQAVSAQLEPLRHIGVCIHLDDFGTGFSSLAHLQRLPFDRLKIDRSFVSGICDRPADWEIVRAITALSHALGKAVIAEGVETVPQFERLQALGVEFGQGWLFSRPVLRYDEISGAWAPAAVA